MEFKFKHNPYIDTSHINMNAQPVMHDMSPMSGGGGGGVDTDSLMGLSVAAMLTEKQQTYPLPVSLEHPLDGREAK